MKVTALNLYPVKGLKGVSVDSARCTARGLERDRRFVVVDAQGTFLTQRSHPAMATVWTDFVGDELELSLPDRDPVRVPQRPEGGERVRVTVWKSECEAIGVSRQADAWLSSALGTPCRLLYQPDDSTRFSNVQYAGEGRPVSFADGYAMLAIGEASLADLNAKMAARGGMPLPMNRFRPNLVIGDGAAFAEDGWDTVRVGEAVLQGVKPCDRCQVTTTDQATGELRGPEPLATLLEYRNHPQLGPIFGMNCVVLREGRIRVGDTVVPA